MDVEMYRNRTENLFFDNLQIASFTGFNVVDMNVGTLDNQGWELGLNTIPYKRQFLTLISISTFHGIKISFAKYLLSIQLKKEILQKRPIQNLYCKWIIHLVHFMVSNI